MSSQDKGNDRGFQKYVLKKDGKHWLLECNRKLIRLTFLTDARDVSIDENVIFADDDLYQITESDAGIVEFTKIEDSYHKTSNKLHRNTSIQEESDNTKLSVRSHEHLTVASDFNIEQSQEESANSLQSLGAKSVGETDVVQVVALFSYEALHNDDISFEKGDKLEVNKEMIDQNVEWCIAKHYDTDEKGYVPRHYVTEDVKSLYSQDWYYNISRSETDRLLGSHPAPVGTFLVRGSAVSLLLAVKANEGDVKHYSVRCLDNGRSFISPRKTFDTMLDLVSYYKNFADGLCCKLTEPYQKKKPSVRLREIEVERPSVELLEQIRGGTGHYGDRHAGKFRKTLDVAVKRLKPNLLQMPVDELIAGIKMISKLRHDKVVQVLAICAATEPILIVSEFVPNGSLLEYLRREDVRASLCLEALIDIAAQIALGMAYLEENNIVHGDLRAAKCLVGDHKEVKVADHGLFQLVEKDLSETYIRQLSEWLPIKWFAPDVFWSGSVSTKSDVWSYGVLLSEIITFGDIPYPDQNGREVLDCVGKGYRMPKPVSGPVECPDPFYETMLRCWNNFPESRPSFAYLKDYFENYTVLFLQYRELESSPDVLM